MRVDIPSEYLELCANWHNGQDSMLYAISSCGYLGTGTIRPEDCETDEDWMISLLNSLECEINSCLKSEYCDDYDLFMEFLKFTERMLTQLQIYVAVV